MSGQRGSIGKWGPFLAKKVETDMTSRLIKKYLEKDSAVVQSSFGFSQAQIVIQGLRLFN